MLNKGNYQSFLYAYFAQANSTNASPKIAILYMYPYHIPLDKLQK
jgi:hypothetical protein